MTAQAKQAEQLNILGRATARVDSYCRQTLRATAVPEQLYGPDYHVTVQNGSGLGRVILSFWPILEITSVEVSPNSFPRQWVSVPAGYWDLERPTIPVYGSVAPVAVPIGGQAILIAQGYINWCNGRNGIAVRVNYINGWPHTSLTAAVTAGATTIPVDDCTGWAITGEFGQVGAAGLIYDSGNQETVQVTAASATSGQGNLTLSSPLAYSHQTQVMVTTLPQSVIDATILLSAAQALQRGATSTTVHAIPGGPGGGSGGPERLIETACGLLDPFKATI